MDGFEDSRLGPGRENKKPIDPNDTPIPFDDAPIPFDDSDDDPGDTGISRTPVNLDSSAVSRDTKKIVSSDRITGVKTFFTKLQTGGIDFIDGRINGWLAENPGLVIKRTNTATGMMVGKKTEPNIIVTIWY